MSFTSRAQRDDKYKRIVKLQNSIKSKIDDRELIKEMKSMLLARKYRKLEPEFLDKATFHLTEWASELNTHRSRLADISFVTLDSKLTMEEAVKALRNYLLQTYSSHIPASVKGVSERKSIVDDALEEPLHLIAKLDRILKLSDVVQNELEASFKNNTLIKNIVEIRTRPDRV